MASQLSVAISSVHSTAATVLSKAICHEYAIRSNELHVYTLHMKVGIVRLLYADRLCPTDPISSDSRRCLSQSQLCCGLPVTWHQFQNQWYLQLRGLHSL